MPATTSSTVQILDRAEFTVGVANATDRAGVSGDYAAVLADIGYTNVLAVNTCSAASVDGVLCRRART